MPTTLPRMQPFGGSSLMSVTVKQVNDAASSGGERSININGFVAHNLKFVGRMMDAKREGDKFVFVLYDGTGRIVVDYWLCTDDATEKYLLGGSDGDYVTVHAMLSTRVEPVGLVAHSVRKVADYNTITMHMLEAIHCHVDLTIGKKRSTGPALKDAILRYIRSNSSPDDYRSVRIESIAGALGVPLNVLRPAIDELRSTGDVYNTIDEWNFRST